MRARREAGEGPGSPSLLSAVLAGQVSSELAFNANAAAEAEVDAAKAEADRKLAKEWLANVAINDQLCQMLCILHQWIGKAADQVVDKLGLRR